MRCKKIKMQLGVYLYGGLKESRRRKLEKHLNRCRECATELDQLKAVINLLPEERLEFPSADEWRAFNKRTLARAIAAERLLSDQRRAVPDWLYRKVLTPSFAAATVILICLFIFGDRFLPLDRSIVAEDAYVYSVGQSDAGEPGNWLAFYSALEADETSAAAVFDDIDRLEREMDSIVEGSVLEGGA